MRKLAGFLYLVLLLNSIEGKIYESQSESCRIETWPNNGNIVLLGEKNRELSLGEEVPIYSRVRYECQKNHYLSGSDENLSGSDENWCFNGKWARLVPNCEPKCAMRHISSISYVTQCSRNVNGISEPVRRCSTNDLVDPGTEVRITCQTGYQSKVTRDETTLCQRDGSWSRSIAPCVQRCGEETPEGTPYIIGGEETNNTKVPWHVGIYRVRNQQEEPEYICGGTILNAKVIISAIHCFWDALSGDVDIKNEYRIVAGKFYSRFSDGREKNQFQVLHIAEILHPPKYQHLENLYAEDLAVVILDGHIVFKTHVAPICMEYNLPYEDRLIEPGEIGRIAGWGLDQANGNASEKLKLVELPVVGRGECRRNLDIGFRPFLTSDKFCAGFKDHGVGLCFGDSGGGLVFPKMINGKSIYFLRGVVSIGPNKHGSCDANQYTLFTNVAHFAELIKQFDIADNRSEESTSITTTSAPQTTQGECIVTKIPRGGSLWNSKNEELSAGDTVVGKVDIRCNRWYAVPVVESSQCVNGIWDPPISDCKCASLNNSSISTVCSYSGNGATSCSKPSLPVTIAKMECPPQYFRAEQSIICSADGEWRSLELPNKCRHLCGYKHTKDNSDTSWGIILRYKNNDLYKCHASILNSVYAITQADCVEGYSANQLYLWSQNYTNSIQSFENGGKFALIRTKSKFVFNEKRMPICLDDSLGDYDSEWAWPDDPIGSCMVNIKNAQGYHDRSTCLVNGTGCIWSHGAGHYQAAANKIEGIKRYFLYGIGERAKRTGEDKDGMYNCVTADFIPFEEPEYNDLDFLDHFPR